MKLKIVLYCQITRGQVKITPQFTCVLDAQNWSVLRLKRNAEQSMVTLHVSRSIIFKGCKQRCITFSDWYMVLPLTSIWQHLKLWWLSGLWTLEAKREYYQNCFIYCQRATSSMGTVNKHSSYSPVGPWVCLFVFFRLHDLSLCWCMFCFTLVSWIISLHVVALA